MSQISYSPSEIDKVLKIIIDSGINLRVDKDTLFVSPKPTSEIAKLIKKFKPGLIAILTGKSVNNWEESLEKGSNDKYFPFLDEVYKRAFYNFDFCKRSKNGNTPAQKTGADVIVYLTSDRVERIDEKFRYRKDWSDIALEYISNETRQTLGWMEKDLGIDYLCYAFVLIKRVYLFPWQQLKIVWNQNKIDWLKLAEQKKNGFSIVKAPNFSYYTLSCAIPTDLLIDKIKESIVIQFKD